MTDSGQAGRAQRNVRLRSRWYRNPQNWMVIVILLFTGAIVSFKLGFHIHPTADIDRAAIATAELSFPRIQEIERMFVCPCGRCGELELEVCECDGPGGAMEMKTAIARALRAGSSTDEIVSTLAREYGGLKPEGDREIRVRMEQDTESPLVAAHKNGSIQGRDHFVADPDDVLMVVKAFDCPCGNCALTLVECTCDHARGAVEVKGFIKERFEAGVSADLVIDEVDKKYGGRRYSTN